MELLTVKEVSKILKVNVNYIYKLMNKGYLKYLVLGSKKITNFELERFLREAQGKDFSDLENVKQLDFNIKNNTYFKKSNKEFIQNLKFICDLKKDGYITQYEFEKAKKKIFE